MKWKWTAPRRYQNYSSKALIFNPAVFFDKLPSSHCVMAKSILRIFCYQYVRRYWTLALQLCFHRFPHVPHMVDCVRFCCILLGENSIGCIFLSTVYLWVRLFGIRRVAVRQVGIHRALIDTGTRPRGSGLNTILIAVPQIIKQHEEICISWQNNICV